MAKYRNPSTGVVVDVPKEVGDRLRAFEPVTHAPDAPAEVDAPKRTTRRKKSE